MKILIINEFFSENFKSGANIVAYNNYYSMKNDNNCFFYSTNYQPLMEKQDINSLFPQSNISRKNITETFLFRINSLYNYNAAKNLDKVIKQIKPDIIHIHALLELSYSVILTIKKYKIPYVITVHDAGFVCPVMGTKNHECSICTKNVFNCIKNKCSRNNYLCSFYAALKFWINRQIIKSYPPKLIITPSEALMKKIILSEGTSNIPVKVVPNTLDKIFEDVKPNYENKGYFLFVGCMLDIKGIPVLLEAIKQLPKDIKFHFVGIGQQYNKYVDFVKNNGLSNVNFIGALNRNELISEYQNCIALITPSVWFEIFGMINIEAFINGKPVIASKVGGIPEIVEHNRTGLLFENGNIEQLKVSILKYWNDRNLVIEHGKKAYEKATQFYLGKNLNSVLNDFYEEVIKNGK